MFTQIKPLSKFPAYCRPLIQTLRMQNKDNQVKFGDRFHNESMGAHEFQFIGGIRLITPRAIAENTQHRGIRQDANSRAYKSGFTKVFIGTTGCGQ